MKEAIQKAIEGGWREFENSENNTVSYYSNTVVKYKLLLDPLFWQALSKAEQWEGSTYGWQKDNEEKWLTCWHRFIDHLASGKDVDSFFEELL